MAMAKCKSNCDNLLKHYSKKNTRIVDDELMMIFQQVVNGMDFLHSNEIIHGDLNPKNILIQTQDNKIVNFDRIHEMIFKVIYILQICALYIMSLMF